MMLRDDVVALVSDADGTLVNTTRLIRYGQYETARRYLIEMGVSESEIPTYKEYVPCLDKSIGGGARHTFEHTFALLFARRLDILERVDFGELFNRLDMVQDEIATELVKPYPGLKKLLHYVGDNDIKFAIFTSGSIHHVIRNFGIALPELEMTKLYQYKLKTPKQKLRMFSEAMAKVYGIHHMAVVTIEDVSSHKPNPEGMLLAMKRLHAAPSQTVMLGDQAVDMQAAKRAGVAQRIGTTHGFNDKEALIAGGATDIVGSLGEIIS